MDDEPTPAPRRRRTAVYAFIGGLLAIGAFALGTSGGSPAPKADPAAPASFEIQGVQDEGNQMRRHRGRDCPKKHQREQQQESGDAGV